jgi:hypothetical protein
MSKRGNSSLHSMAIKASRQECSATDSFLPEVVKE